MSQTHISARAILEGPTEPWNRIPFGFTEEGDEVALDLSSAPHTLVTGATGSGKTCMMRLLAASAVKRGHDVRVGGHFAALDFADMAPVVTEVAVGAEGTQALLRNAIEERDRRFAVLKDEVTKIWHRTGLIRPITLILDDAFALDSDLVSEARALAASLARTGKSVGIHLAVGSQAVLEGLGSEFLSNLTNRILTVNLDGWRPSREYVQLAFPGQPIANEMLRTMSSPPSFAARFHSGGSAAPVAVQVPNGVSTEIAGLLQELSAD